MSNQIKQLQSSLSNCLVRDRYYLQRSLEKLARGREKPGNVHKRLADLSARIQRSSAEATRRQAAVPAVDYPAELPVSQRVEDIKAALSRNQVVIIAGETGSGKTTQIPKMCLELGRGVAGMIGHTQPRRLAAQSVAARIAEELGTEPGAAVGYQVRFKDFSGENTLVKLMTDGILLAEIQRDPHLLRYDTIIIDEAHERSLNIDFLLGYIKRLLPRRPDLKLIITSATIDVEKFSRHFDNAPVVEVSGRSYPVDVLYRPLEDMDDDDADPAEGVVEAVREIRRLDRERRPSHRDILVFLSGEKEIRDVADRLRKEQFPGTEILPLYARLSSREQNRIFQSHTGRRIVLATNVAETSLTVPGIGYVIDSGKARISRYSVRGKIQRLPIEPISQASARQRAGRCGRLSPGVCIRLYSEEDLAARPEFTDTEINRTNLASVILQMLALGLGEIQDFPFVDQPDPRAVKDGFKLLEELGAVGANNQLTESGKLLARIPVDPRFGRMILEGARLNCLREILIITSALGLPDPRERPLDRQQAADEKHRRFEHPESDFLAFVNLWEFFEQQREQLGTNQLRKFCRDNFLSFVRMREWREIHRQLRLISRELKFQENQEPAGYEAVHQALLGGLLSQVASRLDSGEYLGARNRKFHVFPGSALVKRKFQWIVSAELVETSRLFARMNARIEPEWLESLAGDLVKRHYSEPHWSKSRGKVMAYEKVTLYGLTLAERRRVQYGPVDPDGSRRIFIREALANMQLNTRARFYHHNKRLIESLEQMEEKTRRRDILVDEHQLAAFYEKVIPEHVMDAQSLARWLKKAEKDNPRVLFLTEQDLLQRPKDEVDLSEFPDRLEMDNMALPLDYRFDPGRHEDGVTVKVPLAGLQQLREEELDWLVPGMLREKCIALVKSLPKPLRRRFVPVPDCIDRILPDLQVQGGSLKLALSKKLREIGGVDIPLEHWQDQELDSHLRMNIQVVDGQGNVLGAGKDLDELKQRFSGEIRAEISRHAGDSLERKGLTDWDFGTLPERHETPGPGVTITTYPALVDEKDSVALRLMQTEHLARLASRQGVARLLLLRMPQQARTLRGQLLRGDAAIHLLAFPGDEKTALDHLLLCAARVAFSLDRRLPREREAFEQVLDEGRAGFIETAEKVEALFLTIMRTCRDIKKALKQFSSPGDLPLRRDVEAQLEWLLNERFLLDTPWEWLQQYPRYLQAVTLRLEKYPRGMEKDRAAVRELEKFRRHYDERAAYCRQRGLYDEALEHYRWMIEEYRVSLFAQQLGTRVAVSSKRLERQLEKTG